MSLFHVTVRRENTKFSSKLSFTFGESLLSLCQKAGIPIETPCNGKGICGRCKVRFTKNPPLPKPAERRSLSPEQLRAGFRLACVTSLTGDCEVMLPEWKEPDAVRGKFEVAWKENVEGYFIAADIGTTTLVMEKRKKCDGKVAAVFKGVNAQRAFGADVLSRMEASVSGKREQLSRLITDQLEEGIEYFGGDGAGIDFMVIAANTTMVHLLMGYDVERLGRAPFVPETLDEILTRIGGIRTYIMPGFSAFVGGDIAAGIYMTDFFAKKPLEDGKWKLFIDLGTNAELVLFDGKNGLCCATAAGPAFDGDAGTGFFGSDMIALLAKLLEQGIVDETGALDDEYFETGVSITHEKGIMQISQKQIRNLQLAKAAVRSGIEILLHKEDIGKDEIGQVYLAGGFGYYLDVPGAVKIGLLPGELGNKTVSCGNAALLGAAVYGHKILTGEKRGLPVKMTPINLAEEEQFAESYVNYLDLKQPDPTGPLQ